MAQLKTGFVNAVNGSNIIRRVEAVHLAITGTWIVGDALTYNGVSTGVVLDYIPTESNLLLFVQDGTDPPIEAGQTIINDDQAEPSTTITAIDDRTDFDTFLTPYAGKLIYFVALGFPAYAWNGIVDASLRKDSFLITETFTAPAGAFFYYDYGIHVDFTAAGRALLQSGDRSMPELINRNSLLTERLLPASRCYLKALNFVVINNSTYTAFPFKAGGGIDPDGWFEAGGGIKVLPTHTRIDIQAGFSVTAPAASDTYTIHLVDGAGSNLPHIDILFTAWSTYMNVSAMNIEVTPNDIIRFEIISRLSSTTVGTSSWMKARASG